MNKQSSPSQLVALLILGVPVIFLYFTQPNLARTSAYPLGTPEINSAYYAYPVLQHPTTAWLTAQPLGTPAFTAADFTPKTGLGISIAAQRALTYVAERNNVSLDSMLVVVDLPIDFPISKRRFQAAKLLDVYQTGRLYYVLVDLDSNSIVEDINSIRNAENQARFQKYGKLHSALRGLLQISRDDDVFNVAIWVIGKSNLLDVESEIFTLLASRYPEVQFAIKHGRKPMDVLDPKLANQIYIEYAEMLDERVAQQVAPLMMALSSQSIKSSTTAGLPVVFAALTKIDILRLEAREDVGLVFLADAGERFPRLTSVGPTNRVPIVWSRGYDGYDSSDDVRLAILEDGNVDFTSSDGSQCPAISNNCFLHPGPTRVASNGTTTHTTLVASVATSNHSVYRGMAPGVTILSAGINSNGFHIQNDIDALVWALAQGADVVNASYGLCRLSDNPQEMQPLDWAFDYYARQFHRLVVVAVANIDVHCPTNTVRPPSNGWNVLAVGAYDDKNDSGWANDTLADFSSWGNPVSIYFYTHEKPDVVAPGVNIVGVELDGNVLTNTLYMSGTSFAAPQVAGIAALLIDRNPLLRNWPEASRAIIMASAIHNIDGPQDMPIAPPAQPATDWKDGAGGVDASFADSIAATQGNSTTPCAASCWWGTTISNTTFPVGSYITRTFAANGGERIRVAISWWSQSNCFSEASCTTDVLNTDLDLEVFAPNATSPISISASLDNNVELVDFVAPQTGIYTVGVYKTWAVETSNSLGIAVLRVNYPAYLPAVLNNHPIPTSTPTPTRTLTPTPTRTRTPTPTICFDGC